MFVTFWVTPSNDRVLCVYAPSGHNIREQLAREHFFERLQKIWEIKMREIKKKIILGETGMAEIKYKYFRDVILIMPCQNSLWIMGLRIYGEGKTKILLSSPTNTTIDPLAQDPK